MRNNLFIALGFAITTTVSGTAFADTPTPPTPVSGGSGVVNFTGTVLDTPCGISPESISQIVDLGQIAHQALDNGGKSTPVSFDLKLTNCSLKAADPSTTADWSKATVMFSGTNSTVPGLTNLLGTVGAASNIAVGLQDTGGKAIALSTPTSPATLSDGDNTLRFAAFVEGGSGKVVPGTFSSVANFTISYQ